jgi:hypothetical protein
MEKSKPLKKFSKIYRPWKISLPDFQTIKKSRTPGPIQPSKTQCLRPPRGVFAFGHTRGLKHADNVAFKGRFCKPPELGAKFLWKVRRFAKDFQNHHVSPRKLL